MENRLIMLPQPILVSEKLTIEEANFISHYQDVDGNFFKVIAGLPDLPTLDLSLIAEEIGWVDVEKLAESVHPNPNPDNLTLTNTLQLLRNNYISGFKAAQSLNEKKYSEEDIINAFYAGQQRHDLFEAADYIATLKPKEYQVEVEMEVNQCDGCISGHPIVDGIHKLLYPSGSMVCKKHLYDRPKITNNTIKIIKIL